MYTVSEHTTQTLEEKRSKFIAHLFPYDRFDTILAQLRDEHPKARHFVTGFRYVNEFDQIVEGCSDDGEPKGTSGKPTLAVLQGHELINIGIITVRYFGGIKLGPGGLVRAYGDSANLVIDHAALVEYHKEYLRSFACSYSNMGIIEYEMQQHGIRVADKEFGVSEVLFTVSATQEALDAFFAKTDRLIDIAQTDQ
jgi:uncharacterized YigZ family protein